MGRDGVDTTPLSEVPHLAGVVATARRNVVAVGQKYHSQDQRVRSMTRALPSLNVLYPLGEKFIP